MVVKAALAMDLAEMVVVAASVLAANLSYWVHKTNKLRFRCIVRAVYRRSCISQDSFRWRSKKILTGNYHHGSSLFDYFCRCSIFLLPQGRIHHNFPRFPFNSQCIYHPTSSISYIFRMPRVRVG